MSERTLKQLVGALVVALALWGIASFLSDGGGSIAATGDIAHVFDGMTEDAVERVRFAGPEDTVELTHADGSWRVNGFDTNPSTVERLLRDLSEMEIGDLAAANPANHARMGVSADSAVTFEAEVDGEVRTLLVGDQGPRFGTSYARLPDEDAVYVVEGDLRTHARRRLDDWRRTEVLTVDSSQVARIEIERDGDAYTLVRGDSVWTYEDGGAVDPIQARNVLIELSSVIAAGFLTEADSLYGLPQGGSTVAYSDGGEVLADVTIGSGTGERWVRAAGDSITYRLSTFRIGRLAPTKETMDPGS